MGRRRRGRPIDGVLALDKPAGMSSNAALQKVRALFYAAKAGHTGSLDPAATGVLPLCFGRATRFARFLLDADKQYLCRCVFGVRTRTGDAEGEVIEQCDAGALDAERLARVLEDFRGAVSQTPPMYSAVKVRGQPLYRLARQGLEVERPARTVQIRRLQLLSFAAGSRAQAELAIHCSKGAYIRTLVEDIGRALECGAHVSRLHRTHAGGFSQEDAVSLEELESLKRRGACAEMDSLLRPTDDMVAHLPEICLPAAGGFHLRCGQAVRAVGGDADGLVRIRLHSGEFIGVGEMFGDGTLTPRCMLAA